MKYQKKDTKGSAENLNVFNLTIVHWWLYILTWGEEGKTFSWKWVKEGYYYESSVSFPWTRGGLFQFLPLSFFFKKCPSSKVKSTYIILYWSNFTTHLPPVLPDRYNLHRNPMTNLWVPPNVQYITLIVFYIAFMPLKVNCESSKVRLLSHCCRI